MNERLTPSPTATPLVVLFHGFGAKPERLEDVQAAIRAQLPDAHIVVPILWEGWLANTDPVLVTKRAIRCIDDILAEHAYERIILVGYSGGGIIARKLVVYVNGEHPDAPFEDAAQDLRAGQPWASRIERVVLLAGMNQGWSFAPTANIFVLWTWRVAYYTSRAIQRAKLFGALRRGEPFVTDLRIQWLSLTRAKKDLITVVQLLGTIDDIVSPDDNIDLQTGRDFYYLDVPGSGHKSILDFRDHAYGEARRNAFVLALMAPPAELAERCLPLLPTANDSIDPSVRHVLFVIHGIRDYGFWTAHVARHVVAAAHEQHVRIVPVTPTYGYFAMLPFVLPGTRWAKVRWFMEEYTRALARFPNAERFSYIGHSNGTYLLAGALSRYRCCHFWHVVFAGSVVRTNFPWHQFTLSRVHRVLNYVASADWVVALFPRFLARLRQDVGGAGWDGFPAAQDVENTRLIIGAHSTALREHNWNDLARFILDGTMPQDVRLTTQHAPLIAALARLALPIWLVLLGVILLPVLWFIPATQPGFVHWSHSGPVLFTLLWFVLMRAILTRL